MKLSIDMTILQVVVEGIRVEMAITNKSNSFSDQFLFVIIVIMCIWRVYIFVELLSYTCIIRRHCSQLNLNLYVYYLYVIILYCFSK